MKPNFRTAIWILYPKIKFRNFTKSVIFLAIMLNIILGFTVWKFKIDNHNRNNILLNC